MKRLVLLVAALLIFASQAQAEQYRIYEAGKPVVPTHVVRERVDGSWAVFPAGKPVVPTHIIKPRADGSFGVYPAGKPVIPIQIIKPEGTNN